MSSIVLEVWMAAAIIAAVVVIGMLHAVTSRAQHELDHYELRIKTRRLRRDYDERLRLLQQVHAVEVQDLSEDLDKVVVDDVISENEIVEPDVKAAA